MDKGHYKTTGAFMLLDMMTGNEFDQTDPRDNDAEPVLKTPFVQDQLDRKQLEELELFAEDGPSTEVTAEPVVEVDEADEAEPVKPAPAKTTAKTKSS